MKTESIKDLVVREGKLPPERVEELENISNARLIEMDRTLLLVFARWSPFPILCLRQLAEFLSDLILADNINVVVVDEDVLRPEQMQTLFGEILHSGADSFWIKNGQIHDHLRGCPEDYGIRAQKLTRSIKSSE